MRALLLCAASSNKVLPGPVLALLPFVWFLLQAILKSLTVGQPLFFKCSQEHVGCHGSSFRHVG